MSRDEIVEVAIQGHASTRDAIRWAIEQEREACAKLVEADGLARGKTEGMVLLKAASRIRARGDDDIDDDIYDVWKEKNT